jgi:hypothetical protein
MVRKGAQLEIRLRIYRRAGCVSNVDYDDIITRCFVERDIGGNERSAACTHLLSLSFPLPGNAERFSIFDLITASTRRLAAGFSGLFGARPSLRELFLCTVSVVRSSVFLASFKLAQDPADDGINLTHAHLIDLDHLIRYNLSDRISAIV